MIREFIESLQNDSLSLSTEERNDIIKDIEEKLNIRILKDLIKRKGLTDKLDEYIEKYPEQSSGYHLIGAMKSILDFG